MNTYHVLLAIKSAWNRKFTLSLMLLSISLSVILLLGVERLRNQARESFSLSISGTDLIVGARTSPIELLLYAVFHIGEASHTMSWDSFDALSKRPDVAWAVPLSLGDSHRGYSVVGTNASYFQHFQYGDKQNLQFWQGSPWGSLFDAVVGSEAAAKLGLDIGSEIILNHGESHHDHQDKHEHEDDKANSDALSTLTLHSDKPFKVVGILKATGTPVDQTIHIGLEAMTAIHLNWQGGAPMPGFNIPSEYIRKFDLRPKHITAVLVGLKQRNDALRLQREINASTTEALIAVLPSIALDELWSLLAVGEKVLRITSVMVVLVSLFGLVATILASLNERRRELAILRSVGAGPWTLFFLLLFESAIVTGLAIVFGVSELNLISAGINPFMMDTWGLKLPVRLPNMAELHLCLALWSAGLIAGIVPSIRAYRLSLADGLSPKI